MKKLIAISVMCALVAGAAFAETTVGGQVFVGASLLGGDNIKDSQVQTSNIEADKYNVALKISFSEGNAGGRIRILGNNSNGGAYGGLFDEAFVWWRPIPQLRIQFGSNQDGDFGNAQISGWGFTGENKNNGGNQGAMGEYSGYGEGRNHSRTVGWYGGTGGTPNLQFTINVVENLTINLWIPFNNGGASGFTFAKTELNLQYRIVDIGNVTLSFQSNTGFIEGDAEKWYGAGGVTDVNASPKLFASFYLTAIENMGVDLGLAYKFPFNNTVTKTVTNHPFEIGLGFRYNITSDFQFKLRTSFSLAESTVVDGGDPVKKPLQISVNILPNYTIGSTTIFLYAGLGIQAVEDWTKETGIFASSGSNAVVAWFVNPYAFIRTGGSVRFKVGFQLWSDGVGYPYYQNGEQKFDTPVIKWAIPIGFYTYF